MWSSDIPPIVEPSKDVLGWLLIYARAVGDFREGDPYGDPDYFPSRRAAKKRADEINSSHREIASRATRKMA